LLQLNSLPEVAAVAMEVAAVAMAAVVDMAAAVAMAAVVDMAAAVDMAADLAEAEVSVEAAPDFPAAMSEASAEAAPDFPAAVSGACTPLRPVLASGQCLVPGRVHASTGMSGIADSIIAGTSSLAATVAITTAVIRFGMATLG
jgi:hypothetical protein